MEFDNWFQEVEEDTGQSDIGNDVDCQDRYRGLTLDAKVATAVRLMHLSDAPEVGVEGYAGVHKHGGDQAGYIDLVFAASYKWRADDVDAFDKEGVHEAFDHDIEHQAYPGASIAELIRV